MRGVFDIGADDAHADGLTDGFGHVVRLRTITAFEIRRHRHFHPFSNACDDLEHATATDMLAVGKAVRERNARARGRDSRKSCLFHENGAGDVPRVWKKQNFRALMELAEGRTFRMLCLFNHLGIVDSAVAAPNCR
jgi:hypothetical protein